MTDIDWMRVSPGHYTHPEFGDIIRGRRDGLASKWYWYPHDVVDSRYLGPFDTLCEAQDVAWRAQGKWRRAMKNLQGTFRWF